MNAATRVMGNNKAATVARRHGRRSASAFAEARSPLGFRGSLSNLTDYVGDDPTNATDPSGLIEVDDNPDNEQIKKLKDVTDLVNQMLTDVIKEAKQKFPAAPAKGLAYIYDKLGKNKGIFPYTVFEKNIENELTAKQEKDNEGKEDKDKEVLTTQITRKSSRYGKIAIKDPGKEDPTYEKVPYMWRNLLYLGFAFAPVVKIAGVPIGTDKLGHFIQQGYWYFTISREASISPEDGKEFRQELGLYLEGAPELKLPDKVTASFNRWLTKANGGNITPYTGAPFGVFGWISSGVVSYADMVANEAGFWFYVDLEKSWNNIGEKYTFDINALFKAHDIDPKMLNEYNNPNKYHPYLARDVTGPQKK